jgi:hypothetical protein
MHKLLYILPIAVFEVITTFVCFLMVKLKQCSMSLNKRQNLIKNQCLRIYVFCIQKMCRVAARRLSIYNFTWGLLKASNLQAESKILKKLLENQIYQKNFPKKVCLVP